ncbi:MAG: carboxypeptidase regulatory-like domain-containing protein [Verrucomicrobia bacterium]|nr:carboxypeptidase regulatory-like domain-containing protein [Verrucomicrobiota bacterium]MDA1086192.1 carboxypeptidase regulatory-like domain-containing protein [Verrucomicrobiota bacterium]
MRSASVVGVAMLMLCAGCGKKEVPPARTTAQNPVATTSRPAASGPRTGTARVTGKVIFKGRPRPAKKIDMSADAHCVVLSDAVRVDEKFIYAAGEAEGTLTIGNVFVWIKEGLPAGPYAVPEESVILDQRGCRYVPRVLGIMVGQKLQIVNSDPTMHNVHSLAKNGRQFNNGMAKGSPPLVKTFQNPEVLLKIKCDAHPWMSGYAGVVEHPFFAVTGADGGFALENLPAGTYEVAAMHELLNGSVRTVTVGDGESVEIEVVLTK